MSDPIDTVGPWTIKSVGTATREAVNQAAKQEGVTVGQWLDKRVAEWLADGRPSHVAVDPGAAGPLEMLAALAAAGIPIRKNVGALANRLVQQALRRRLEEGMASRPAVPAIGQE